MDTIRTLRLRATALLRRCLWPLVRRLWLLRYSGAGGYFHDAGGNRIACVVIGLDDCPFMDDAILVETPTCKGASIERADFHPHGRGPNGGDVPRSP